MNNEERIKILKEEIDALQNPKPKRGRPRVKPKVQAKPQMHPQFEPDLKTDTGFDDMEMPQKKKVMGFESELQSQAEPMVEKQYVAPVQEPKPKPSFIPAKEPQQHQVQKETMPEMKIHTNQGIAEPMPASDLQINNKLLKILVVCVALVGVVITFMLVYIIWLTDYIISNNVVNNIVANCLPI